MFLFIALNALFCEDKAQERVFVHKCAMSEPRRAATSGGNRARCLSAWMREFAPGRREDARRGKPEQTRMFAMGERLAQMVLGTFA